VGDLASVQAVTRVNAEQASKRAMRKPTRQRNGEGRRCWNPAWPGPLGKSGMIQRFRRGNGDGMHIEGDLTQHGKPDTVEGRDLQPDAREGTLRVAVIGRAVSGGGEARMSDEPG
jgi:hypothetical protein